MYSVSTTQHTKTFIPMIEMKIGDIGKIHLISHGNRDHIVLRTYSNVVSLTTPSLTWRGDNLPGFLAVELLKPGESITLTVQE